MRQGIKREPGKDGKLCFKKIPLISSVLKVTKPKKKKLTKTVIRETNKQTKKNSGVRLSMTAQNEEDG